VGFQLENLLSGESPLTLPEPVFRSPRDLRRLLGLKVKRNWHQPAAVVVARSYALCPNLQQHVYMLTEYSNNAFLYLRDFVAPVNPLPQASSYSATFCWCGLNNPTPDVVLLQLFTNGRYYRATLADPMSTETGCVPAYIYGAGSPATSETFQLSRWRGGGGVPGPDFSFEQGGGMSLQFP
jgi:hypothetical protein